MRADPREKGLSGAEVVGQCEGRSQGEGTVRGGGVRPSGVEANIIVHRSHIKIDQRWREKYTEYFVSENNHVTNLTLLRRFL